MANWRGAYNSGTAYAAGDSVSSGGLEYYCVTANTGHTPGSDGDWALMGTFTGPGAATSLDGVTVTGTPSSGQVVTATSGTAAGWSSPASGAPSGSAGGDLGSTYPNPQVTGTHLASALPVAQGGTAATTAGAALTSLGAAALASPSLTGTPTAPTATALTNTTQLATTAYADAAVTVESSRATTAEALKLAKASNLSDLASSATALTNLGALPTAGGTMSGAIAMGSHKITGLTNGSAASDAAAFGQTAAGGAIVSGQFLCTPTQYAPGSTTTMVSTSTTFSAMSSSNINTGSFTAPASGSVVVTCTFGAKSSTTVVGFGLCAHGTITPMIGNTIVVQDGAATTIRPYCLQFIVTGLTAGNSFNFDLMHAVNGSVTVSAQALTATTISTSIDAMPVTMTVQAV